MSSKSRKSISLWMTCEKCQSIISQKDLGTHGSECPPSAENWSHSYIKDSTLHSTLEIYSPKELPKHITERNTHEMVFMSETALQLCEIAIGDRVLITSTNCTTVKTAWPTSEKSLGSICLTKTAIENNKIDGQIKAQKFIEQLALAKEIIIDYTSKSFRPKITPELEVSLKCLNERKVFCEGNQLHVPYYGRNLGFKIVKITGERDKSANLTSIERDLSQMSLENYQQRVFYESLYSTKWTIVSSDTESSTAREKPQITLADVGGYQELIADLRDIFDVVLGKCLSTLAGFKVSKGVLLYGSSGVGKTTIANALISSYDVGAFVLNAGEIYTRYSGEGDTKLKELFSTARDQSPSVILIEDIDMLCPKKPGENEKRVMGRLLQEIDELQDSDATTLLLATTSKPDAIDSSLRRARRIDREFEVSAPTPQMRREILDKLLAKVANNIPEDERDAMSFNTHGFIAADMYGLCARAAMHAIKRHEALAPGDVQILPEDTHKALRQVKPSAMKEILVEVANVKWCEIGGQESLKLKLKQAVEWPLRHPEVFKRLGITPPKGVLMYGPPGCSKTMIAKALATESKLNFINIKGPELFSKWVGESERAVREVFRKARQVAPSIVFIDEIDALGGERASGGAANSGNNVQERVLTQLLTELDGVTALGNVTLVAATNRPDRLDKALLRPGRLDRIVYVPLPDRETRQEIFEIKFAKMPVAEDVTAVWLAERTERYSGAEIQALCHEAAMNALNRSLDANIITWDDFEAAFSIVSPRTPASLVKMYEDYLNNK